ncbi:MAG: CdaR family protein [Clostridia bacterium]|nr:CdaR family protein [Clostridia bacterium]
MKKKKFSLNKLMMNNKFLLVLSLLISLTIWVYMSYGNSSDTNVTLSNIPIQIELSDEARNSGLQIFSGTEQTASITVTGSRATLGSVNESDVTVTAAANTISSAGSYTLPVSATKTNPSSNFQLTSTVVPSTINVVVDYLRESTFQIQENVVYRVADGYYASTSLATKSIVISGPQTEISKIDKVSAIAEISGTLTDSSTTDADIVLYDKDGNEMSTDLLTMDFKTVKATVSVLPEKTVDVKLKFTNKPDGLEITDDMVSIEPSSILLAGSKDILDKTDYVNLEVIDFSNLKNERVTFDALGIDIPSDCKNISNSTTAKVTLDLSGLSSKKFTVDNFTVKGLSDKYSSEVTQKSISVAVIGPESQIDDLDTDSITGVIDVSNSNGTTGSVQMPVSFKFSGADSCWAYGTYKANVTITEK